MKLRHYPGLLILVAGPSGAGKDSLLQAAAARWPENRVRLVRREITRPAGTGGEPSIAVSEAAFDARAASGQFLLWWRAHGFGYGIGRDVEADLDAGRIVAANVSRSVLAEARRRFAPLRIVLVTAPDDVLAARLADRARDSDDDQQSRLARAALPIPPGAGDVLRFVNDGPFDRMVDDFVRLLHDISITETTRP